MGSTPTSGLEISTASAGSGLGLTISLLLARRSGIRGAVFCLSVRLYLLSYFRIKSTVIGTSPLSCLKAFVLLRPSCPETCHASASSSHSTVTNGGAKATPFSAKPNIYSTVCSLPPGGFRLSNSLGVRPTVRRCASSSIIWCGTSPRASPITTFSFLSHLPRFLDPQTTSGLEISTAAGAEGSIATSGKREPCLSDAKRLHISSSIMVWLNPRTSSKAVTASLLLMPSNSFTISIKASKRVLPRKSAYLDDSGTFTVDRNRWKSGLVNASAIISPTSDCP